MYCDSLDQDVSKYQNSRGIMYIGRGPMAPNRRVIRKIEGSMNSQSMLRMARGYIGKGTANLAQTNL